MDWIIGGWQINNIVTLQDGPAVHACHADQHAEHGHADRSSRIGSRPANCRQASAPSIAGSTPRRSSAPAQFTFGNSGRNILRGPGTKQLDLSLFKSFPFAEKRRVEFRAEAFNALNTPQFNNPNASIGFSGAGRITSAGSPTVYQRTSRQIQLALKLYF